MTESNALIARGGNKRQSKLSVEDYAAKLNRMNFTRANGWFWYAGEDEDGTKSLRRRDE